MKNVSWLFLGLSTVAQLKVFKGYVCVCVCVCVFFFHSSPTRTPVSLRREVHAHQRNPRGRPTSVWRWWRVEEDNSVQCRRRSGSLGSGGWVDRRWVWWVDQHWVWYGKSVVLGEVEIGDGFDLRLLGRFVWSVARFNWLHLLSLIGLIWFFHTGLIFFFFHMGLIHMVLVSLFWSSNLMGLLGFKNLNSHVLGRI